MNLKGFFSGMNPEEFSTRFASEDACYQFLAEQKWGNNYECRKCGHKNYCKGKTPYSRRCTRCKHDESAIAHTPFHGCRIPLNMAFQMAYQICCQPEVSTYQLSRTNQIRQMTCWKLKKKIIECIG